MLILPELLVLFIAALSCSLALERFSFFLLCLKMAPGLFDLPCCWWHLWEPCSGTASGHPAGHRELRARLLWHRTNLAWGNLSSFSRREFPGSALREGEGFSAASAWGDTAQHAPTLLHRSVLPCPTPARGPAAKAAGFRQEGGTA